MTTPLIWALYTSVFVMAWGLIVGGLSLLEMSTRPSNISPPNYISDVLCFGWFAFVAGLIFTVMFLVLLVVM